MKRYLWVATGLFFLLLALTMLTSNVLARLPANQVGSRGVYVQFDKGIEGRITRDNGFPVAGGHHRWLWMDLEPDYDNDYRFNQEIGTFALQEAARGKKAAIGIETFVAPTSQQAKKVGPPYGMLGIPEWLRYDPVIKWNTVDNTWYVLNFLNSTYKAKYAEFIYALADWLAANPNTAANIGWIEMGVGLEAETQPVDIYKASQASMAEYYLNRAPDGENPPGWTSNDWTRFVNWCTDLYYDAFRVRNPSLSFIPIFLNCAPEFRGKDNKGNREAFTTYAATKGIGLKNNGLQADRAPAALYDPLIKWGSVVATTTVPIAWETYGSWLTNTTTLYWGILCALDKHPDVLEPTRDLLVDGAYNPITTYVEIWRWAEPYLGVTPSTTPGIWCALRETQTGGEPGNFFFWLFQNDSLSGGKTVALKPYVYSSDAWLLATGKEGAYTRRTDRATGNPYMHFQVLNPSPYYGNPNQYTFTVTVTYLDKGTDQWKLTYDSFSGRKDAGVVQKTNTNTWKKAVFVLTDARFGNGYTDNGMGGGVGSAASDLTIDCLDSGDEYIHMVEIRRVEGASSPTPTPTTIPCTLRGHVTLQGRPTPPHPRWSVPLTVTIGSNNYATTTDTSGYFTVTGLTPGTYDIRVKHAHTLRNVKSGEPLVTGLNEVDLGTLREGDANDDNRVNITDFSILRSGFYPNYDPRADFNGDGSVNITDFSLLRTNFGLTGDIPVPSSASGLAEQSVFRAATTAGNVEVIIEPTALQLYKGEVGPARIRVRAGSQPVDGVEVHLNFDPHYLQIVDSDGQPTDRIESSGIMEWLLTDGVNHNTGQIDFAVGTFSSTPPSGDFVVATVYLKARQDASEGSTILDFITDLPRKTDVTYGGESVLGSVTDAFVTIKQLYYYRIYLPNIGR